jgi:hypothetical protein
VRGWRIGRESERHIVIVDVGVYSRDEFEFLGSDCFCCFRYSSRLSEEGPGPLSALGMEWQGD